MKYNISIEQAVIDISSQLKGKELEQFKMLVNEIDMMYHKDKEEQWLFGKLFLDKYNSGFERTGSSKAAIESIRFSLRKPMDDHFLEIQRTFETIKDVKAFESANIELDHLNSAAIGSDEVLRQRIIEPAVNFEEEKKDLTKMINTCLNDRKNYD